ncbi:MAG: HAMP domain-containing histidine kinase [Bacteroidetes bacterium]|nr:HAMP domain-containing histidine kinase [Bacteroidota bacterium]
MFQQLFSGKTLLFLVAISIVIGTIFYSRYLSQKIAHDETHKVEIWVAAQNTILNATDQTSLELAARVSSENTDIPIIETNEKDSINPYNCVNLDSIQIKNDPLYLTKKLAEFKKQNAPIILKISDSPYTANKYYYGESLLQKEVRYYPLVQLVIVGLFIMIMLIALRSGYQSTQNRLWAGMAKETAHQLGTPVSSLKGWVEMLKEKDMVEHITTEIDKDVKRLELISDRFGKIGSKPHLEEKNIIVQINNMVDYIKKRSGGKVKFEVETHGMDELNAFISPPLFDWVIENLLKNALDALEGKGTIRINISETTKKAFIEVADNGKGISKSHLSRVFKPGFTTKKRGWGLGLALSKRIIDQYHHGEISVKSSEAGKGTTFRIELNKMAV